MALPYEKRFHARNIGTPRIDNLLQPLQILMCSEHINIAYFGNSVLKLAPRFIT